MINSNSAKRFCSFLLCISITLGLLLGSSVVAYADDTIVINGVTCAPVEITNDQIKAMFDNGDCSAFYRLTASTSANISLFDMINQSSSVVSIGTTPTNYNVTDCDIITINDSDYLTLSCPYSYNLRVNESSTLFQELIFEFPFSYYLQNYSVYAQFYYSGISTDQNTSISVQLSNSDHLDQLVFDIDVSFKTAYWSTHRGLATWYSKYNWVPNGYTYNVSDTGVRSHFSNGTISNITANYLVSSLVLITSSNTVHAAGTGYDYFFPAPMFTLLNFAGTVYVPISYEDAVLEYLDLITGDPTVANQQRIDELTNEFQTKEQELSDLAEDLTVDVPDTSGAISGLPAEAQAGANDFATYIFTPIYNIPIVGILVACAFGFAVIKLLLYGSGSA